MVSDKGMVKDMVNSYEDMTDAEWTVASFLLEQNVGWKFEHAVYVTDDANRPRVWTPDFYLPELGIYVEVCGARRSCYSFRQKIYEKNKIPIIFVHTYKEESKWKEFLLDEIHQIHQERWEIIKNFD